MFYSPVGSNVSTNKKERWGTRIHDAALSPRWLFHNGRYYVQLPNGLFVIQILIVFGCPHETGGRLSRDEQNGQRIAGLGSTKHTPDYGIWKPKDVWVNRIIVKQVFLYNSYSHVNNIDNNYICSSWKVRQTMVIPCFSFFQCSIVPSRPVTRCYNLSTYGLTHLMSVVTFSWFRSVPCSLVAVWLSPGWTKASVVFCYLKRQTSYSAWRSFQSGNTQTDISVETTGRSYVLVLKLQPTGKLGG